MEKPENIKDETDLAQKKAGQFSYYCPYCKAILSEVRANAGEIGKCRSCSKESRVPRPKLSIKGELPFGIKIEEAPAKPKLSLSGGKHDRPTVSISTETATGPAAQTPARPAPTGVSRTIAYVAGFVIIAALAGFLALRGSQLANKTPPTPAQARPSEEVVYSKIEYAYQRLQKAEMSHDIMEGDKRTLDMLKKIADPANPMDKEAEIIGLGIAKRNESIQGDLQVARETVEQLAGYHRLWSPYLKDLLEKKIQEAKTAGNAGKAAWLEAISRTVQEAPPTDDGAREFIKNKITL